MVEVCSTRKRVASDHASGKEQPGECGRTCFSQSIGWRTSVPTAVTAHAHRRDHPQRASIAHAQDRRRKQHRHTHMLAARRASHASTLTTITLSAIANALAKAGAPSAPVHQVNKHLLANIWSAALHAALPTANLRSPNSSGPAGKQPSWARHYAAPHHCS